MQSPRPCLRSRESAFFFFLKILFIYFYRGEGREKERERNINAWLPLTHPPPGRWSTTQACALTGNRTIGNRTIDHVVHRPALSPLSHTCQGCLLFDKIPVKLEKC